MKATAKNWADRLFTALDVVALSALAFTFEVSFWIFGVVALAGVLRWKTGSTLPQKPLFALLALLIVLTVFLWLAFGVTPLLCAAYGVPLLHAALWYSDDPAVRGWRLGLAFGELAITVAITAEFYVSFFILIFAFCACLAISCAFLQRVLGEKDRELLSQPLPKGYMGRVFRATHWIFLSAALIFPILPRMNSANTYYNRAGYTEEINLSDWTKFSGGEVGDPVLWLYPEKDADLLTDIYMGLIRGRTLELYDGKSWSAINRPRSSDQSPGTQPLGQKPNPSKRSLQVEAIRAALPTPALPVPYGTYFVQIPGTEGTTAIDQTQANEWRSGNQNKRVKYRFSFHPFEITQDDRPTLVHQNVPAQINTERMSRLSKKIFSDSQSDRDKIDRVLTYFKKENFRTTTQTSDDNFSSGAEKLNLSPLERFLFVDKQGHCEKFASSLALLLRMSGVPTRLVAGFRISSRASAGSITIRSNDAHAWVEAWVKDRGWIPIDPTPRLTRRQSMWDQAVSGYETMSGLWFRYILSFEDFTPRSQFKSVWKNASASVREWTRDRRELSRWSAVLGLAALLIWLGGAKLRNKRKNQLILGRRLALLIKERTRLERWISRLPSKVQLEIQKSPLHSKWWQTYEDARFGPNEDQSLEPAQKMLNALRAGLLLSRNKMH